mmetsp:Transcript_46606/g.74664  ORF Transcript_46606/g.74664 Transcript_46606/m.74664 type:complete len:576 (+) Transcript_46606:29-1756(+)
MKRGGAALHSDSAPPPKKRKIDHTAISEQTATNGHEASLSPDESKQPRFFKPGQIVYEDNDFQFEFLYNDEQEDHLIALTDLKQIFAACLPRMGTRYVTRHVFDEHHRLICCRSKSHPQALGIHEHTEKNINYPVQYPVIGGICIRPFYEQHFGEVVFLAVHNQHQHKSVGRKIMRVMKHVAIQEGLSHFYTYADNQAIGFFQKLAFVKKRGAASMHKQHSHSLPVAVPESRDNHNQHAHDAEHAGYHNSYENVLGSHNNKQPPFWDYIKHYTGSELMECKLYSNVDYIHLDENLSQIEKDILLQCQQHRKQQFMSDYETVHEPIAQFLIPINKLIVILDLDDNFENEQDDEALLELMDQNGIQTDRDLYDVYKTGKLHEKDINLKAMLLETFRKPCGEEIYQKFVTYLTKPNDKKVAEHIDLKIEEIEGFKPEWQAIHNLAENNGANDYVRDLSKRRSSRLMPVRMKIKWILKRVMKNDDAYPFNEPVPRDVPGYYERIKHPIDMKTMNEKNERGQYAEWSQFDKDFKLMIANCKEFNQPGSDIVKMCTRLNEYYQQCCLKYDKTMTDKKRKNI